MNLSKIKLPIDQYLEEISKIILGSDYTLIKASTGSGKTTRVPFELLKSTTKKVLVLEPRKLAAKMLATRISQENNLDLGLDVGYLFKGERSLSPKTRLLFITEGTLSALLESDPELTDYDVVILDEFHERNLESDLAFYHLKKVMEKRKLIKSSFHVVFMTATISTDYLKNKIPQLKEFEVIIPPFPLSLYYLPNNPLLLKESLSTKVKNILKDELPKITEAVTGVLVFVPGKKEILDVIHSISSDGDLDPLFECTALHGELSKVEQDIALSPSSDKKIKLVVSTNIAESSITLPYINIVIDSGLKREYVGNVKTGFGKLITLKIDKASAEQRAGRSNRLSAGHVFRLYSQQDFSTRQNFKIPQILSSPLIDAFLILLRSYQKIEAQFFLDEPPKFHQEVGLNQLQFLNLIDESVILTREAKTLDLSLDIRLSLIESQIPSLDQGELNELLTILTPYFDREAKIDFKNKLVKKLSSGKLASIDIDEKILFGFLDLVGFISSNRKVTLQSGESLLIHPSLEEKYGRFTDGSFVVVLMTSMNDEVTDLYPIDKSLLMRKTHLLKGFLREEIMPGGKKKLIKTQKFGVLTLDEKVEIVLQSTKDQKAHYLSILEDICATFFNSQDFIRYKFFCHFFGSDNKKIEDYETKTIIDVYFLEWSEIKVITDFEKNSFLDELKNEILLYCNEVRAHEFESLFPKKMKFTDRRETPLHYEIHGDSLHEVFVESYLQDFYGLKESPKIADGKIHLTFKLLGPRKLALQVTKDLNSFWANSYPQIQKELSRDYPRHHWPLDPRNAPPVLLKRQLS